MEDELEKMYQDGNDLMSVFMGGELRNSTYHFPIGVCPPLNAIQRDQGPGTDRIMRYHQDWQWLMQVVEKIEQVDNFKYKVEIRRNSCDVCYFFADWQACSPECIQDKGTKGEAVWHACLGFIKWYNNEIKVREEI